MHSSSKRIGVIGCGGRIHGVLRDLLSVVSPGQIEITALYDPSEQSIAHFKSTLAPQAVVFNSEEELLESGQTDWVAIGSVNSFHADQVVAALRAGKHVFCEKPLATRMDDCVRISQEMQLAQLRGQLFFFGLVLRYVPLYQRVKAYIDNGCLGQLISFEFNETLDFNHGGYIHGNWRRSRELSGSHVLEKCCHDVDLTNWLVGSLPVKVASFGGLDFFLPKNKHLAKALGTDSKGRPAYQTWADPGRVDPFSAGSEVVDNQVAILQYANGVRATFHTNCNAAIPERRIYLLGSKGALRVDAVTEQIEFRPIGFQRQRESVDMYTGGGHCGGDMIMAQAWADSILRGAVPRVTLGDGICSAVSCFGIDEAMESERVVSLLPLWEQAGVDVAGAYVLPERCTVQQPYLCRSPQAL